MSSENTRKIVANLSSSRETERLGALRDLVHLRKFSSVAAIVAAFKDRSRAVQEAACEALIALGGREVVAAVLPLLEDGDDAQTRSLAIQVLSKAGKDAPELLYDALKTGSDDAQIFVLDALGMLGIETAIEPMSAALASPNVNVRNACVMAMSRIASHKTVPWLLKALEDDEWVRFSAIEGLGRSGDPSVIPKLLDKLKASRDEPYYTGVLECFIQMQRAETAAPLFDELAEAEARYHPDIVAALTELLAIDGALEGVNAARREHVRGPLKMLLKHPDPWAAFRTFEVIRALGDRAYLDEVLAALESKSELERAGAMVALAAIATAQDAARIEAAAARADGTLKGELLELADKFKQGKG